jgi:DNA-3-methyladenine glycosylase
MKSVSLPILRHAFYNRPAVEVARDLLGKTLVHQERAGRIVEVEAYVSSYGGEPDLAAHSARGITPRTRVIFGGPGHAYVYLIYGMYECLNIVVEPEGTPGCILVRALEPLWGVESCSGPGKLTRAMGITRSHYGTDLTRGELTVRAEVAARTEAIVSGPRIGIRQCAGWPLRFYLGGNEYVTKAK